jgi:hypothetical protein
MTLGDGTPAAVLLGPAHDAQPRAEGSPTSGLEVLLLAHRQASERRSTRQMVSRKSGLDPERLISS